MTEKIDNTNDTLEPKDEEQTSSTENNAPAWMSEFQKTVESLKTVIESQKETIDKQAAALEDSTAKMQEMSDSFKQQTANLVQHGVPSATGSAQATSDVYASLQPPTTGYTTLRDLDVLPEGFRDGKTKFVPATQIG